MLIQAELNAAINAEVGLEFFASHQYVATAAWFEGQGLKLLAKMFYKQGSDERDHAMKFIKYVVDTGGSVEIPAVSAPKSGFGSVEEAVQLALTWELEVTKRCNDLMAMAIGHGDYAAQDFLRWFVTEQVEEVSTMENLLKIVRQVGPRNIIMVEAYLVHGGG